jgi:hypothetical protein
MIHGVILKELIRQALFGFGVAIHYFFLFNHGEFHLSSFLSDCSP